MIVAATLKSPCMECDCRHMGCHCTCENYKEYKEELERRRAEAKEKNDIDDFCRAVKSRISKANRDRRKGDDR